MLPPPHSHSHSQPQPSTVETGANAEQLAVDHLIDHGYEIVERNYRSKLGELDIVAIDRGVMVFVEVRSRTTSEHGDAAAAVGRRKQRQVTRIAEIYLHHRRPVFDELRFDVVTVDGDGTKPDDIDLYQDAWRGGLL